VSHRRQTGNFGFGLDLAGYTTGRTSLAAVTVGKAPRRAWLLRDSPFSKRYRSGAEFSEIVNAEVAALCALAKLGPIAVDVPIDLQKIGRPRQARFVWELTKRPVDQVFNAMPPLADRIGAPYARMQAILAYSERRLRLGENVFETYPKASLSLLSLEHRGYKGDTDAHAAARQVLCGGLGWCTVETDHDLDALLCAATAAADPAEQCKDSRLAALIAAKLPGWADCTPPKGYVLLRTPRPIMSLEIVRFQDWIESQ
jgi:hypothetical protein